MKLSSQTLKNISKAVHEAERQTNGEIVVYMVNRSDRYSWLYAKAAALGLFLGYAITLPHNKFTAMLPEMMIAFIPLLLTVTLLALTKLILPLQKIFIGENEMDKAVADRACKAFVSEEIFKTKDRTGILIFISLFEREVLVIGDAGINAKVTPDKWSSIVKTIVDGIKSNQFAKALHTAILNCGTLLEQSGLTITADDKNELSNELRYFDE